MSLAFSVLEMSLTFSAQVSRLSQELETAMQAAEAASIADVGCLFAEGLRYVTKLPTPSNDHPAPTMPV